ncbi:hypothetical protein Tco_1165503 [Tanacetum coccineum]
MEEDKELDEEVSEDDEGELIKHLVIKKDEDIAIDAIPLATKLPVISDYKLHKEGMLVHYQLIRADGSSKRYSSMIRMLQGIDREDLEALWKIVKIKYSDIRPKDEFERVLSILTDSKVTPTKHGRMTKPYSSPRFIANYFNAGYLKMVMEGRSVQVKELQERCIIEAFKISNQEKYEHVGPNVMSSQDGKVYKMAKRDYAWLMISRCSRSHIHIQVKIKEQAQA